MNNGLLSIFGLVTAIIISFCGISLVNASDDYSNTKYANIEKEAKNIIAEAKVQERNNRINESVENGTATITENITLDKYDYSPGAKAEYIVIDDSQPNFYRSYIISFDSEFFDYSDNYITLNNDNSITISCDGKEYKTHKVAGMSIDEFDYLIINGHIYHNHIRARKYLFRKEEPETKTQKEEYDMLKYYR